MPQLLSTPIPFSEALDRLAQKRVLPTGLGSAEIREEFSADLRRRSLFSARTTKAAILQEYQDKIEALLKGETNIATARMEMQSLYDALGYTPEFGFAGDEDLDIPPAERGTIRDLSSRSRIDLVLMTNMRQCANYGFWKQGQTDFARWAYPCYELVRIYPRVIPRGMRLRQGALEHVRGEDWPSRWEAAGGVFVGDGRMIARKDDPIWSRLGDSTLFPDALDTALPPFAFNSGYGWREIDRDESIRLGVIEEDTEIEAQDHTLNENVQASVRGIDPELLRAAIAELDVALADGKVRLETLATNAAPDRIYVRDHLGRFALDGSPLSHKDNMKRGNAAVDRALRRHINIRNAMNIEGIGQIDFPWGVTGDKTLDYEGGYGIAHVLAKHGEEDAHSLPRMILEATSKTIVPEIPPDPSKATGGHERRALQNKKRKSLRLNRIELTGSDPKGSYTIKLVQKRNSRSAWLLTGFTRKVRK